MLRLQKIEKDLLINRDNLLAQIHEMSAQADDSHIKLQQTQQANKDLDLRVRMLHTQLVQMNPGLVEEQKQLIVDLQTKVKVVEKELALVSKKTLDDMKVMQNDKERLQGLLENRQMDGEVSQQVSDLTIH